MSTFRKLRYMYPFAFALMLICICAGCENTQEKTRNAAEHALGVEEAIGWTHFEVIINEIDGEKSVVLYNHDGVPGGEIWFMVRNGKLEGPDENDQMRQK